MGGGAAGLSAALAAAETRARVIVADEQPAVGGALRFETGSAIDGAAGWDWAQATAAKLAAMDNVRVLTRTTAFGYYAQNMVGLVERCQPPSGNRRLPQKRDLTRWRAKAPYVWG